MSEAIRGRVDITEADHVEAYVSYATHAKHVQTTWKLIGVVLFITAVGVAVSWPVSPGVWTVMSAVLLFGLWLSRSQWAWVGRRAFRQLPKARRRYEVAVSTDGMHAKGPRAEVRYVWSTISGWIETTNLFVLLATHGVADICPKRSFEEADLPALRALFDECVVIPEPAAPAPAKPVSRMKTLTVWIVVVLLFVATYSLISVRP